MKIRSKIIYSLSVFFGLLSLITYFYPMLSDDWNRYVSSILISEYIEQKSVEENYLSELEAARCYNQELYHSGINHIAEYMEKEEQQKDERYESLLNVNEVMACINIEKIGISLPIYHYASEEVLSKGVGHLYGSSLPVGGENTHAVLTGHSGLMKARLFTDLNKLQVGDSFTITILGESHEYVIDQIMTILPDELEPLGIEEGKDMVTLVTCTPYGINTHRLLVRGIRTDSKTGVSDDSEHHEIIEPAKEDENVIHIPYFLMAVSGVSLLTTCMLLILIWRKK